MQQAVASKCGWEPVGGLLRLEGFQEPWEKAVYRGRELQPGQTLEAAGLQEGAVITAVRKVLVAEGWKVGPRPTRYIQDNACVYNYITGTTTLKAVEVHEGAAFTALSNILVVKSWSVLSSDPPFLHQAFGSYSHTQDSAINA